MVAIARDVGIIGITDFQYTFQVTGGCKVRNPVLVVNWAPEVCRAGA
jgi:hypothetical protein